MPVLQLMNVVMPRLEVSKQLFVRSLDGVTGCGICIGTSVKTTPRATTSSKPTWICLTSSGNSMVKAWMQNSWVSPYSAFGFFVGRSMEIAMLVDNDNSC